jgi:transketolase C-terminal domain/subunit
MLCKGHLQSSDLPFAASFSTRSKVPYILKDDGSKFFGDGYEFVPGKDETILEGSAGYIVTFGDELYRSHDAALRLRQEGLDVGLINKPTLNIVDEETTKKIGSSSFVLVVETLNQKTGVRFASCLPSCRGLTFYRF